MVFSAVMYRLAFLSRVAFICNVSLLLSLLLRYLPYDSSEAPLGFVTVALLIGYEGLAGIVLALGLALSFIMNPIVNIWYAIVLIRRQQPLRTLVPVWLATVNFLFLILQLYLVL